MPVHPIQFAAPSEKIVAAVPEKSQTLSRIIPSETAYTYDCEADYYAEYRRSRFAITFQKNGWDSLRHYEILMNGCIPIFPFLEQCPQTTMVAFPRELLLSLGNFNAFFEKKIELSYERGYRRVRCTDFAGLEQALAKIPEETSRVLTERLLAYTRRYLTTRSLARYVLDTSGNSEARSILFFHGQFPNYNNNLLLHGMKLLYGENCYDSPIAYSLYTSLPESCARRLYGRGMTYTRLLDQDRYRPLEHPVLDLLLFQDAFDVVLYDVNSLWRPGAAVLSRIYPPNRVLFFCSEDIHDCDFACNRRALADHHHFFQRESLEPSPDPVLYSKGWHLPLWQEEYRREAERFEEASKARQGGNAPAQC